MGLGWKDSESGKITTISQSDLKEAFWYRVCKGYRLDLLQTNGKHAYFENFTRDDGEVLERVLQEYLSLELKPQEHSIKGWNWGSTEFRGSEMQFMVGSNPAFTLPLTQVASTALAGKNEVALDFAAGPAPTDPVARRRAGDSLVEIRFYVPGMATREQEEEGDEEGEINTETVLGKDGEALTAASWLHDNIRERGDIGSVQTESIVSFSELLCLTPRGRYDIDMHDTFFRLRGKSHDYKILYSSVTKLFLLAKPDGLFWMFIVGLEPPLRQGQTRYPYLCFQFAKVLLCS